MKYLSRNAMNIEGQPMFKLIDKIKRLEASGKSIIHMEIGDPDFATPRNIVDSAIKSLNEGETHYTSSWGHPAFIDVIRRATERTRSFYPEPGQTLVLPGANIAIFYAIFCLTNPGDEVLVPDPGFPTYLSSIKMTGAVAKPYPLYEVNNFGIDPDDIESRITEKTRLIIINSPQNPTGGITKIDDLIKVYNIAEKYDLYVYSDEIYSRMVYGSGDFFSISTLDKCKKRVILANGFSKAFAMTGWRLGTLVAPSDIAEKMMLLLQTTSSCVPVFIQRAGIEAIEGNQDSVLEMLQSYKMRRDLLVDGLNKIEGITCHTPGGAFYAFPNISKFSMSSVDFADYILEEAGVAILPGTDFGSMGEGFVRICYATSSDSIIEALARICSACKKLI